LSISPNKRDAAHLHARHVGRQSAGSARPAIFLRNAHFVNTSSIDLKKARFRPETGILGRQNSFNSSRNKKRTNKEAFLKDSFGKQGLTSRKWLDLSVGVTRRARERADFPLSEIINPARLVPIVLVSIGQRTFWPQLGGEE